MQVLDGKESWFYLLLGWLDRKSLLVPIVERCFLGVVSLAGARSPCYPNVM